MEQNTPQPPTSANHTRPIWARLRYPVILLLTVLFFLTASYCFYTANNPNSDFFTFWLAGRLAASGENPYMQETWVGGHLEYGVEWIPNQTFIYPLPLAYLFIPLGLLPYGQAYLVWAILTQWMILSSILLLVRAMPSPSFTRFLPPLLAGAALFRPTLLTLRNGQLTALLVIIAAAVAFLWQRGNWRAGSALLPLLALKPNLGMPIIGLLAVYLLFQKQYRSLGVMVLSGGLIFLSGFLLNNRWLMDFWSAGSTKLSQTFGYSPTVWGLAGFFTHHSPTGSVMLGAALCLAVAGGLIVLFIRGRAELSPLYAVSLALTGTLLITPYTWPYDQLLLVVPVVLLTYRLAERLPSFLPAAILFLLLDILALALLLVSIRYQTEIWNAALPLLILCALILWRAKEASHVTKNPDTVDRHAFPQDSPSDTPTITARQVSHKEYD